MTANETLDRMTSSEVSESSNANVLGAPLVIGQRWASDYKRLV